jgi:hypothetical protein
MHDCMNWSSWRVRWVVMCLIPWGEELMGAIRWELAPAALSLPVINHIDQTENHTIMSTTPARDLLTLSTTNCGALLTLSVTNGKALVKRWISLRPCWAIPNYYVYSPHTVISAWVGDRTVIASDGIWAWPNLNDWKVEGTHRAKIELNTREVRVHSRLG